MVHHFRFQVKYKNTKSFRTIIYNFISCHTEWFPGWVQHENYNRQPNDDSTDEQDCVEIRRHFHKPASGLLTSSSLTESFMWNDRDCNTKNFFLCERPLIDGKFYYIFISYLLKMKQFSIVNQHNDNHSLLNCFIYFTLSRTKQ